LTKTFYIELALTNQFEKDGIRWKERVADESNWTLSTLPPRNQNPARN
jgi:hypothetical protein